MATLRRGYIEFFKARPRWKARHGSRSLVETIFGRPLKTDEEAEEQVGALQGVPILGLDALASAAYGPEAALTVLLPLGMLGVRYLGPLSVCIVGLLALVYLSYRQTIDAYPGGGGSYTVAKENLGQRVGLLAAAALGLDYMLNVAVAISAGIGALVSAVPSLQPYTLALCLAVLGLLTAVNLRGLRSSGLVFMAPTYLFVGALFTVIALGIMHIVLHQASPRPAAHAMQAGSAAGGIGLWLLLRAFASGCTAMTGVEAVSNGVPAFRRPASKHAKTSLALIIGTLVILLLGVALLARAYGITATDPDGPNYRSVLSQIVEAVVGRGPFYYVTVGAIVSVLMLSANTSFADFPRLCRLLAVDGYLPEFFAQRGRRLAFTVGIGALATISAILLIAFRGITNGLIPLFAVGAFLAFTLSQTGMVQHWRKQRGVAGHRRSIILNALGATATGATLVVIVASKFTEGAWISILLVGAMLLLFQRVHAHGQAVERLTSLHAPLDLSLEAPPIAIVPLRRWNAIAQKGMHIAVNLSPEVYAVQVLTSDREAEDLTQVWDHLVASPCARASRRIPKLVVLQSDYRELFNPLLDFIKSVARANPERYVMVVVSELVERRWYHSLFRNHTASILKSLLLMRGDPRILVVDTPWYWGRERRWSRFRTRADS